MMDGDFGGPVSASASPSGGAQTDDVKANINVGEFIIPKDIVQKLGTDHFHKMLIKTREKSAELVKQSGAIPTQGPSRSAIPLH
jgi:BMFP domain-containing protein YqiC